MAAKETNQFGWSGGTVIRFNLTGLIIFSVSLLLASTALTCLVVIPHTRAAQGNNKLATFNAAAPLPDKPWGDLMTQDILLEKPDEFMASVAEANLNREPVWNFAGMLPEQVKQLLTTCGLSASLVERALSPQFMSATTNQTVVKPDAELVLAIAPAARAQLYQQLAHLGDNFYMEYPVYFSEESLAELSGGNQLSTDTANLLRKLLYPRDAVQCFSDVETTLRLIPSAEERNRLMRVLSQQPAVLARLRINADTDIDQLINYWSSVPEAKVKDMRPVLEAIKATPGGGNLSLLYLLPPFARERLYTSPLPPKPGDGRMDCHWSTVNFFNKSSGQTASDSFLFTAQYITQNFDKVQKPERYGDIIVVVGSGNQTLHSAVYIADDIFFTKNGDNYMQPWTLMRMKDILNLYRNDPDKNILAFRRKNS